jgi:hypothetical protein
VIVVATGFNLLERLLNAYMQSDPKRQAIAKMEKLKSGDGKLTKRIERMEKESVRGRKKKYFVTNA